MGDFNTSLFSSERSGGATSFPQRRMEDFQHMVHQCGLVDLGFLGRQFTWSRGTLSERLDRAFASTSWRTQFPKNCSESSVLFQI